MAMPRRYYPCRGCSAQIYGGTAFCKPCQNIGKHIRRAKSLEDCFNDGTRRKFLIRQRGHFCEECGLKEWRGQLVPIEMSHEDGNSDNNSDQNLKLKCRNCHGIMADHKGRGRLLKTSKRQITRRKRYSDGKTW